jgi:hypothetical protein
LSPPSVKNCKLFFGLRKETNRMRITITTSGKCSVMKLINSYLAAKEIRFSVRKGFVFTVFYLVLAHRWFL